MAIPLLGVFSPQPTDPDGTGPSLEVGDQFRRESVGAREVDLKTWTIHANGLHLHRGRPSRWMPRAKCEFWVYLGRYKFLLQSVPFKGICAVLRMYRAEFLVAGGEAIRWEYPSMKKRVAKGALEGDAKHLAAVETTRFADLMSLVEHCAFRKYDDGDPREPGWFTIKTQGSAWVVQVKDPDAAVSFAAVAQTLDQALETAALMLACDEAPWEQDRFLAQQAAQKKKK